MTNPLCVCGNPATYRLGFPEPAWCNEHGPYGKPKPGADLIEQIRDQLLIANKLTLAHTYPKGSVVRDRLLAEVDTAIIGEQP